MSSQAKYEYYLEIREIYNRANKKERYERNCCRFSAATIDRVLAPLCRVYRKKGILTTKPGSLLKKHIPVKTNQWNEQEHGFLETDTVAHCGTSMAGMFAFTVNIVDIYFRWTAQRAVWGKGERGVLEAIADIEHQLPFPIKGFDCDNGSEFLNWHFVRHFQERKELKAQLFFAHLYCPWERGLNEQVND